MKSHNNHASHKKNDSAEWFSLSQAAAYLGVHFSTLRRWSDTGKIPCMRTPGGRRKFSISDLQSFIAQSKSTPPQQTTFSSSGALLIQDKPALDANKIIAHEPWFGQIGQVERIKFKGNGQMMLSLMMQYIARTENDDPFLRESKKIAVENGKLCALAGLSITETVETVLLFRKAILKMLFWSTSLDCALDETGKRLHERSNDFLDALLITTIEGYSHAQLDLKTS